VLMAAGYIVGMRGLFALIIGAVLTWGIAIPIFVSMNGLPEAPDLASAMGMIQKAHFRYVAVGVLAIGGLWSVISLMKPIVEAFKVSMQAMKTHKSEFATMLRTDRDMPFKYVIWGVIGLAIPIFILFFSVIESAHFAVHGTVFWSMVFFATIFSLVVAFIASAIAAYITGIVGTTSLPISGITIFAILAFSSILLLILKPYVDFNVNADLALKAAGIVIIFAAVICIAAALSGDNMQDLKAGQLVGATPWKQQLMLAIGAVAAALVIPFILQTTFEAYGIGDVLPRAGMNPEHALPAPQATLMATVAKGFFVGQLPWNMILVGAALAVFAIVFDIYLKKTNSSYRFPPLVFALGIYFPLGYVTAFFVGGLVRALAHWGKFKDNASETNHGILCASGIIAGEAILGALLTIPFAYYQSTDIFALKVEWLTRHEILIGVFLYLGLCAYLYKRGRKA
jgi:putative OPT family oligopeptide transporter